MAVVPIEWERSRTLAEHAAEDVARRLREVRDGSAPVPGLRWTISEVGAHLVTVARGYTAYAKGASSSREPGIAEINEERLRRYPVRDPALLADELMRECAAFLSAIELDDSKMSLSEVPIDRATGAGILLGELRIHELDIASALHKKWTMAREEALIVMYSVLTLSHMSVDAEAAEGFTGTYEIRLRGGEAVTMAFDDGTLEVSRGRSPRADCRTSIDPVASLLLGYGRISPWRVGLAGKAFAWGRKPWLALRFNKLLQSA